METITYKGYDIEIGYDDFASNPFEEWDCNLPLISTNKDYSDGGINDYLSEVLTDNQIIRHQSDLCEVLDIEYFLDDKHDKEDKIDFIRDEIRSTSSYSALEKVCELAKVPCLNTVSRGYSQGDWSNLFICYTDEFEKITGCTIDSVDDKMLQSTADLFGYWAWGDVYCYNVLDKDGDVIDSCGGFYGDDHDENGLMDMAKEFIDSEVYHSKLKKIEKLKVFIKNRVPLYKRTELLSF